mmetsp:Transcript_9750/g.31372  ORF Transcript_9750/g.31372 Transcript_9750/m.31372 type:complete len:258 (-) Transcript_9750:16-789(-)
MMEYRACTCSTPATGWHSHSSTICGKPQTGDMTKNWSPQKAQRMGKPWPASAEVSEVGKAVASQGRLGDNAAEGEHGEAAVADLLLEHRFVGLPERVHAEVARPPIGLAGHHLIDRVVRERLNHANGAEQQQHVARFDGGVVRSKRRDVRGERHVEAVVDRHIANPRQHADPAVLQLGLAHVVQVEGARQVEWIKAPVACHGAVELGRGLKERESLRLDHHGRLHALNARRRGHARVQGERLERESEHPAMAAIWLI